MTERYRSNTKTQFGYIKLLPIALAVLGIVFLFNSTAISSNNNKYGSSIENIEWGMSPARYWQPLMIIQPVL